VDRGTAEFVLVVGLVLLAFAAAFFVLGFFLFGLVGGLIALGILGAICAFVYGVAWSLSKL